MKKKILVIMSLVLMLSWTLPYHANAKTISNDYVTDNINKQESETVFIDGTSYTYDYSYENNHRVIYVTNNNDNSVEKVSYNENTSTIYYNDEVIGTLEKGNDIKFDNLEYSPNSTWKNIGSGSKYVSWARGITAAAVAAVIAIPLASLNAVGVIAAMGTAALGVIAAGAIGGTVKYTLQMYTIPNSAPLYRYVWSFRASTGDNYGSYISHI